MGSCLSSKGVAISLAIDVDAPFEVMWDTLTDVANYASFLGPVERIELQCKKGGKLTELEDSSNFIFKEGAVWKETSTFTGKAYTSLETITSIEITTADSDDDDGNGNGTTILSKSVHINSTFIKTMWHEKTAHTATYSVHQINNQQNNDKIKNKNKCQLRGSAAFLPDGCFGILDVWRRGKQVNSYAHGVFENHLYEYKLEAEKRYHNHNTRINNTPEESKLGGTTTTTTKSQ